VFWKPAAQIVEDRDLVASGDQSVRHVEPMNPAPPVTRVRLMLDGS
jgi:hypothetical protein